MNTEALNFFIEGLVNLFVAIYNQIPAKIVALPIIFILAVVGIRKYLFN